MKERVIYQETPKSINSHQEKCENHSKNQEVKLHFFFN